MPIRIKPIQTFGPCVLTLASIENITARVEKEFSAVKYSATDGAWEVYDEPRNSFLAAIAQRETLDSFIADAQANPRKPKRELQLIFNEREAKLTCKARAEDEEWFEHVLFDIKKHIRPATFAQLIAYVSGERGLDVRLMAFVIPIKPAQLMSTPYCKIVIRQKPPSPFVESIIANMVSNVIWAVLLIALGVIGTFVAQHLLAK